MWNATQDPLPPAVPGGETPKDPNDMLKEILLGVRTIQRDQEEQSRRLQQLTEKVNQVYSSDAAKREEVSVFEDGEPMQNATSSAEDGGSTRASECNEADTDVPSSPPPAEPQDEQARKTGIPDFLMKNKELAALFVSDEDKRIMPPYEKFGRAIVEYPGFERFIGVLIVTNSILLGIETEFKVTGSGDAWPANIEYGFLFVYALELTLRLMAYGKECLHDGWFIFDTLLVGFGILSPIAEAIAENGAGEMMKQIMVIRVLRVLRFVRALRLVKQFQTIWKLVRGLLMSLDVMASTLFLLTLTLYIFACLGMELIAGDERVLLDPATRPIAVDGFGSTMRSMLTLVQFVTLDSISGIYLPLIAVNPWLSLYFICIIITVGISIMNLVTGAIVDSSLQNSEHDRQEKKEKVKLEIMRAMPQMIEVFNEMDADKSGNVSLAEVDQFSLDVLPKIVRDNVSVDSMHDLFELLDVDGGGELSQEEFIGGLLQLWLMDIPIFAIQTLKLVRLTRVQLESNQTKMQANQRMLLKKVGKIEERLAPSGDSSIMEIKM